MNWRPSEQKQADSTRAKWKRQATEEKGMNPGEGREMKSRKGKKKNSTSRQTYAGFNREKTHNFAKNIESVVNIKY